MLAHIREILSALRHQAAEGFAAQESGCTFLVKLVGWSRRLPAYATYGASLHRGSKPRWTVSSMGTAVAAFRSSYAGRASHTGREGDRQASQWLDHESDSHVAVGRPAGN